MGGAQSKDPGKMIYTKHNIYSNFIRTYGRLKPERPVTLHQKALFLFWISIIILWVTLTVLSLVQKWLSRRRQVSSTSEEDVKEEKDDQSQSVLVSLYPVPKALRKISRFGRADATEESKETWRAFARLLESAPDQPTFIDFLSKATIFGGLMFYMWLCDYQHIWPKVEKQYSRDMFSFLFLLLIAVGLKFTVKKTPDKLINRDQTEEWKGWMQVQFVWYHYFDAQEVFNSIRVYIAAYVWMTGFGNFSYFWIRKDYSVFRLMKMMFRLNFLVFLVMAVTNSEFVRYYVCAMHTYWFLSVYIMMAVLKTYNQNRLAMAGKFFVYFLMNALIFEIPNAPYKVFWPFQFILNVKGSLRYWVFRSTLDHWACLVGMLCAYNYPYYERLMKYLDSEHKCERSRRLASLIRVIITLLMLLLFALWFHFFLPRPRMHYMEEHPYTSHIPILFYLWIRNVHPWLRHRYIDLFAWLGKITLETYLSQIHIYMIGDAKRLLVYLPKYPMLNFALATLIYIAFSYVLFYQTVFFSSYILPRNMRVIIKNLIVGSLWLGTCYLLSWLLTIYGFW